jgi:hypothetical protein
MKWGFPPVPISNPTLGLSDEQPKPISGWTLVEFGFGVGKCRKIFKAAQVVVSQVLAGGAVKKGFTKRKKCDSDSLSEENSGRSHSKLKLTKARCPGISS